MRRFCNLGLVLALVCLVNGCTEEGPKTVPVTGKVTIGGQAPQGVLITFHPLGSQQAATGQIDAQGTYTLYTGAQGKAGAEPGKYKVVLIQATAASEETYKQAGPASPGGVPGVPRPTFPDEWLNGETSPKEVEVTDGDNTIDIEVPARS